MNRRSFLSLCAGGLAAATPVLTAGAALAEGYENSVVTQLRRQGYRKIDVERTLLGRVRIVAARGGGSREIILNPRTGEILRDVLLTPNGQIKPQIAESDNSGKGSSGDDSDDGSDDGNDDSGSDNSGSDDGDDNSGSGDGDDDGGSDDSGGDSGSGDGDGDSGSDDSGDDD